MPSDPAQGTPTPTPQRITSIDALRGFVMFTMIFVNDLAGAPKELVPDWMVHFSDRHRGGSGMTFVDLVFPGFLFIVGMSIPFALGSRINKGEPLWKTCRHVLWRTLALLAIGILMVHEEPSSKTMGWSGALWCTLMYLCAILAFCSISRPRSIKAPAEGKKPDGQVLKIVNAGVRAIGAIGLVWLAFQFRDRKGHGIISLTPLHINTSWYGILGLIGWAYLVACTVHLAFRGRRTAILGCMAILTCLFAAGQNGAFDHFWLSKIVDIGGTLGSQAAITVGGLLLGTMLVSGDVVTLGARARFTFWFAAGCATAALALQPLYGISKDDATPSWCLWSCAITAILWFIFYLISDVRPVKTLSRPLALAGQNVLLTYLFSEMLPELLDVLHLGNWYDGLSEASLLSACARSALCGIVLLLVTVRLNRIGFRLKL